VDRSSRAKAADLPVQYPTKFQFVINLTAAKGLPDLPPALISLADEVLEIARCGESGSKAADH